MNYIIENWSEHNLIDRAWFIVGAWLFVFFMLTFFFKILPSAFKNKDQANSFAQKHRATETNTEQNLNFEKSKQKHEA